MCVRIHTYVGPGSRTLKEARRVQVRVRGPIKLASMFRLLLGFGFRLKELNKAIFSDRVVSRV